jgi:hypothetical protein
MSVDVEEARSILEEYVSEPDPEADLSEALAALAESSDKADLELLTEALRLAPDPGLLDRLWGYVADGDMADEARFESLRGVSAILYNAAEEDAELLSESDFDAQVGKLLTAHDADDHPDEVRRFALETAANLAGGKTRETVRAAGRAAYESDDPLWVAAGLLALRKTDPANARTLVNDALDHPDNNVRAEAIRGLAELGTEDDMKRLEDYVFDGKGEDQLIAIFALATVPAKEAGDILKDAREWLTGDAKEAARQAFVRWDEYWRVVEKAPEPPPGMVVGPDGKFMMADDADLGDDDDDGGGGGGGGGGGD